VLTLHRAERAGPLADALAELLSTPLADPFSAEVVAVPAKGVERWLAQRLAARLGAGASGEDGVAANLRFPSPGRLVDEAVAAAGGAPEDDPWAPGRVLWTLLDVVDASLGEPWCACLAAHLGAPAGGGEWDEHRLGRRYATVEHLRDLFRSYAASRPAMLVGWAAGDDVDGTGAALPDDLRWQAELWRRLREALGAPSPAERLEATCERLRDQPTTSDLPPRLSLFGATRTTTEQRAVLQALAVHRDVHLWLPHPSPVMWAALDAPAPPAAPGLRRRADDASALAVRSPMLASLARDTRELQLLLRRPAGSGPLPRTTDVHHSGPAAPASLLAAVQAAVRDDHLPAPAAGPDGSVQVHACHGPSRQVEVLREALLHLFADDPTLEPRDVLVLCPDVEAYAPLVRAAFGQPGSAHPGHGLRVRLADRSLRSTNPLLDTLSGLLALADGRVTASAVLDLAATTPVRRAFGLRDDDLERLREWAGRTGVRWGLGRAQREAHALHAVPQNTWSTGLDRLLLGVAADETELGWLGLALPLDDVDSSDIDLAGRLAELVERLDTVLGRLTGCRPGGEWVAALSEALDLLTAVPDDDAWQLGQARHQLAEAAEHAGDAELRLPDVRRLLAGRLAGRPTRAGFRTGELTVCTMVPDALGAAPRGRAARPGRRRLPPGGPGRRRRRAAARPLPRRARRAQRGPPAPARRADVRRGPPAAAVHRRRPGDRRRAAAGGPARRGPRRPARHHRRRGAGRRADPAPAAALRRGAVLGRPALQLRPGGPGRRPRRCCRAAAAASAAGRAAAAAPGRRRLTDLVALLVHPTRAFLSARLGVRVPDRAESVADALPAELDGLEKWDVGERMLAARLAGVDPTDFSQAEWRRGTLPPGPLGLRLLAELDAAVDPLAAAVQPLRPGRADTVDVSLELSTGGPWRRRRTRAAAHGHRRRRARRRPGRGVVLAPRPEAPADRLGAAAGPGRRRSRPRPGPDRGHRGTRARPPAGVAVHAHGPRRPGRGAGRPRGPVRRGAAGAPADRSVGVVRVRLPAAARRDGRGGAGRRRRRLALAVRRRHRPAPRVRPRSGTGAVPARRPVLVRQRADPLR
jgi:exodeoxyribonuclease V gamma subunit